MSESLSVPWKADDPLITITVSEPDVLSVRMFGVPYSIPEEMGPLTRASFGWVMDYLYDRLGQPFTVEVVETDGSRHAGLIDLPDQPSDQPVVVGAVPRRMLPEFLPSPVVPGTPVERAEWVRPIDEPSMGTTALSAESTVGGASGFLPGEQVAVTVVVGTTAAGGNGQMSIRVPEWLAAGVLLLGRDSGHVAHVGGQVG